MSLRLHGGGAAPAPSEANYGPSTGAQAIRDAAGPRPVSLPGGGTDITPGGFTQAAVNSAGASAVLKLRVGTHRLTGPISLLAGQTLYAEDGAIIKGSEVVSSWTAGTGADTGRWFATGQTQDFSGQAANVLGASSSAANPVASTELEDYYFDEVPMTAVTSKAAVTVGSTKKYMDRGTDTVWIGQNPAGHTVERLRCNDSLISTLNVSNITIIGGLWEHALYSCISVGYYHPTGGLAAISNLVVQDTECRYGHLSSLNFKASRDSGQPPLITGGYVQYNYIHDGGRYNHTITGTDAVTIERNEFGNGNMLHFGNRTDGPNDEGASKGIHTRNMTWQYNWSHDNDGPEWWDTNCSGTIQESVFENSDSYGIMWEANTPDSGLTCHRNHFKNNGIGDPVFGYWGTTSGSRDQANLYLSCSNPGTVDQNIFESNAGVSLGPEQADIKYSWQAPARPDTKNWSIQGNQFLRSYTSGDGYVSTRGSSTSVFLEVNDNVFGTTTGNDYHAGVGTSGRFFFPSGTYRTYTQWKAGDSSPLASSASYDPLSSFTAEL